MTAKNNQRPEPKKPAKKTESNTGSEKSGRFDKLRGILKGRRPQIKVVGRETTSGGIVFRPSKKTPGDIEILLIGDIKRRWTIPKGHVEPGETTKQTAIREIGEEVGLKDVEVIDWLGKTEFKYRRVDKLVLMTMHVYLMRARGDTDAVVPEEWMTNAKWFSFSEALNEIEYEDIGDLMLLARRKVRELGAAK
ncbi:MAG: NUDIX domain-containing protein [Candidatus Nomurabacteria bacterium]|jgi:ADP-ribose pyrophosphatase YjhB (NUDIX family)|nr:NUDIX domain-containing protein [Candidatus Nomurabacteria bacterium]